MIRRVCELFSLVPSLAVNTEAYEVSVKQVIYFLIFRSLSWVLTKFRVPTVQEKQGKWSKNPCQGEHREFGNFAKTQGIWFVHSLILKVKYISIFAAKTFFFKLDKSA